MSLIWIMGTPWFPSRYSEQHAPPVILVSGAQSSPGSWAQCVWLRSEGRATISGWEVHVRFVPGAFRFTGCHSIEENSGRFKIYFLTNKGGKWRYSFTHSKVTHSSFLLTPSMVSAYHANTYGSEGTYLCMYFIFSSPSSSFYYHSCSKEMG